MSLILRPISFLSPGNLGLKLRHDLEQVTDQAVIGDLEDGGRPRPC